MCARFRIHTPLPSFWSWQTPVQASEWWYGWTTKHQRDAWWGVCQISSKSSMVVMPGSAPAITHVSHLSPTIFWLSSNFDLVICLMALHDSVQSSLPVSLVCECDPITSHSTIFFSLSLSKSSSCHLTFADRYDLSLNTSSMFLLMFLGMAVCCWIARRSMVRMFESEDWTGRKVLCSPLPHVSPWEHSNTPYCCPSVFTSGD